MSTRDTVLELARKELGDAAPSAEVELAGAIDSVQQLQLVVAIEDHFELCFEPEDDARVRTLDDLVALIDERLAEGGA